MLQCRRKWDLAIRQGWRAIAESDKLWFGSAFHAGLQAFHSTNPPDPKAVIPAVDAYLNARIAKWGETPEQLPEHRALIIGMFRHYNRTWLASRPYLDTVITNDGPLCEVQFQVDLGQGFVFEGTFDRVVEIDGALWIVEYKTAKNFNVDKLVKDPQSTAYIWAGNKVLADYGGVAGVVYQQHRKGMPELPEPLKRGGYTQNKQKLANVPAKVYEDLIVKEGLEMNDYIETLDYLREQEGPDGDSFVRRDLVQRTTQELESFHEDLIKQVPEYFNPNLPIYPTFTRDCHFCDFSVLCDVLQNKGDAQPVLESLYTQQELE
jgi:hypothetical protein